MCVRVTVCVCVCSELWGVWGGLCLDLCGCLFMSVYIGVGLFVRTFLSFPSLAYQRSMGGWLRPSKVEFVTGQHEEIIRDDPSLLPSVFVVATPTVFTTLLAP